MPATHPDHLGTPLPPEWYEAGLLQMRAALVGPYSQEMADHPMRPGEVLARTVVIVADDGDQALLRHPRLVARGSCCHMGSPSYFFRADPKGVIDKLDPRVMHTQISIITKMMTLMDRLTLDQMKGLAPISDADCFEPDPA